MGKYDLFKLELWWRMKYDRRRRCFRGITKLEFLAAVEKHIRRSCIDVNVVAFENLHELRAELLAELKSIPYGRLRNIDGPNDHDRYWEFVPGGGGIRVICPGERGNDYWISDKYVNAIMKRRSGG